MTGRALVMAALAFQAPPRLPRDLWTLPSVTTGREAEIAALLARYPIDFYRAPYADPLDPPGKYHIGRYTDGWGCDWECLQEGLLGEVKRFPLADYAALRDYRWPMDVFDVGWEQTAAGIAAHRDRFVLGGWVRPWERMQFLRGTEALYMDLAEDGEELYALRDGVFAYYRAYIARWLQCDIDAVVFGDDWGSQRGLLISPDSWRAVFRPCYQQLFDMVKEAGKRVFFHMDGHILAIIPDLVEMGVDALNAQIWCMGLDALRPFAGRLTFWGELDRQSLLPRATREEIVAAAQQMVDALHRNGGLIGQSAPEYLTTSLENVEAALACWSEVRLPARTEDV